MVHVLKHSRIKKTKLNDAEGINSNAVTTATHAFFIESFSLTLCGTCLYKTGKLLTVSDSSYSLDISEETFSNFSIFEVRVFCSSSRIYLFTFFTWKVLIFSLRNMSWEHFWRKRFQISSYLKPVLHQTICTIQLVWLTIGFQIFIALIQVVHIEFIKAVRTDYSAFKSSSKMIQEQSAAAVIIALISEKNKSRKNR